LTTVEHIRRGVDRRRGFSAGVRSTLWRRRAIVRIRHRRRVVDDAPTLWSDPFGVRSVGGRDDAAGEVV